MSLDYEIRQFDRQRLPVAADLAGLHAAALAHSPIPLLGPRFAEGFYYGYLPAAGFLFGAVAYVDSHPAGFAVATVTPGGFLAPALKRPFWVAWLIGRAVLTDPKRISAVWEAWRRIRLRSNNIESRSGVAEILSMGVRADVGAMLFRKKGIRISVDLLTTVISMCRERAAREVRVTVEASNLGTQLLYTTFGWHREAGNVLDDRDVEYSMNLESPSTHGT